MKFLTKYNVKDVPVSCSGEETSNTYAQVFNEETNQVELKKTGLTNSYKAIQMHKDSTDLSIIINKFLNGDKSVINQSEGVFADLVGCPKSFADLFSKTQECINVFDMQSKELRSAFDNDYRMFWASLNDGSYEEKVKAYNDANFIGTPQTVPVPAPTSELNEKGAETNEN